MAALAADRITKMRAGGYSRTIIAKVAAATTIYKGALVAKNAAGHAVPASDAAALVVIGVAQSQVVNAGAAGAAEIACVTGVFKLLNSGANPVVQADMHGLVYVADDQTVRTGGGKAVAGVLELIESDGAWVMVEPEIGQQTVGGSVATVADTQTGGGIPVVYTFAFADAATNDQDRILDHKMEVLDVIVQKRAGAGAAGNTAQVKNTAAAITDAVDTNDADNVLSRPLTIDDANSTVLAGGTLRVTNTKVGGNSACLVTVIGIRRA